MVVEGRCLPLIGALAFTVSFVLGGMSGVAEGRAPTALPPKLETKAPKVHGWEPLGLSGGGNMYAPAISGADSSLMMVSCDMSGAYVSTDGGAVPDHRLVASTE